MGILAILNDISKSDIEVIGVNVAIEKSLNKDFSVSKFLEGIKYKILLIDLHWYEHSYGSIYIAKQSKKLFSSIPVILGGYTSTIFSKEILEKFKDIDYIISGDSDYPLPLLVKFLLNKTNIKISDIPNLYYRSDKNIIESKIKWKQSTLDKLDFTSTDIFLNNKYIPFITTIGVRNDTPSYWLCIARGCIFNCSYCCGANKNMNQLFNDRCDVLLRSPNIVANDIKILTDKGIKHICISHDFEMFGEQYYKNVFNEIKRLNIKPGLYLECFQLPSIKFIKDILDTFEKENILLVISPISGNEELRKQNGKYFNNIDFFKVLDFIKQNRIKLQLYYTLNLYGETKKQFNETIDQIKYIRYELELNKRNIYYQPVVVDPLAGMRNFEKIEVSYNTFTDYYEYCQKPESEYNNLGFKDNGEIPLKEKKQIYKEI
ncbi:B12-binding domain-containing radical SAM protein [Thomasclavelia sp.]